MPARGIALTSVLALVVGACSATPKPSAPTESSEPKPAEPEASPPPPALRQVCRGAVGRQGHLKVSEASGVVQLADGRYLVTSDSSNEGQVVVADPESGEQQTMTLPLGTGAGDDLEGLIPRWTRAHLNCLEFLPIFGAVALSAVATDNTAVTDPLAMVVFYCRVAQSVIHIISTAQPMIPVRGLFFVVQLLIALWWAFQLLTL